MVVPLPGDAMTAGTAFLFGKLPAHGDFVSRGLAPAQRDCWDDWLSRAVSRTREALAADFDEAWFALPPRRFALGPGALGEGWRAGVLAASIDAAGRRFPVVVGRDGLGGPEGCAELAEHCANLLQEELAQADADALVARVVEAEGDDAPRAGWWLTDIEGGRHWLSSDEMPDDVLLLEPAI